MQSGRPPAVLTGPGAPAASTCADCYHPAESPAPATPRERRGNGHQRVISLKQSNKTNSKQPPANSYGSSSKRLHFKASSLLATCTAHFCAAWCTWMVQVAYSFSEWICLPIIQSRSPLIIHYIGKPSASDADSQLIMFKDYKRTGTSNVIKPVMSGIFYGTATISFIDSYRPF